MEEYKLKQLEELKMMLQDCRYKAVQINCPRYAKDIEKTMGDVEFSIQSEVYRLQSRKSMDEK